MLPTLAHHLPCIYERELAPDCSLAGRDVLVVALVGTLELQEFVITALAAVGVGAAHVRAGGVNRAAPRLAVEKAADGPVNLVFVVA